MSFQSASQWGKALVAAVIIHGGIQPTWASPSKAYVWSNSKGLVKVESCEVSSKSDTRFQVVRYFGNSRQDFENMRSRNKRIVAKLANLSLVKKMEAPALSGYEFVVVAGVNADPDIKISSQPALRNYQGYVYGKSLRNIDDYVFQLTEATSIDTSEGEAEIETLPGTNMDLVGGFLQVAKEGSEYLTYKCAGKEYLAFDLHIAQEDTKKPVARIGINWDETKILKNIRTYTAEEAEVAIEVQSEKDEANEEANDGPSQVGLRGETSKNKSEEKKKDTTPIVVEASFESVICLDDKDGRLNVRDESKNKVLFQLGSGDKIKMFQSFNATEDEKYVKIQSVETGRIGWVAREFVNQSAKCESTETAKPAPVNTGAQSSSSQDKMATGEYTVCTADGGSLSVYDMNFGRLSSRYYLDSGEKATVIDGILVDKPAPNGYKYVKVKTESNYTRYVAKDFLTQGKCESAVEVSEGGSVQDGYIFPVTSRTGYSYIPSARRSSQHSVLKSFSGYRNNWGVYGARRSGGKRAHGATDLYQVRGLTRPNSNYSYNYFGGAFRAMYAGKIVRKSTPFYLGTNYIVVHHSDGVVSRYGEIYPGTIYQSTTVKAGQKMGYVKWVGQGSVAPMLHFENYRPNSAAVKRGELGGAKRINGMNSQRSEHLFDRTTFMLNLENKTF